MYEYNIIIINEERKKKIIHNIFEFNSYIHPID